MHRYGSILGLRILLFFPSDFYVKLNPRSFFGPFSFLLFACSSGSGSIWSRTFRAGAPMFPQSILPIVHSPCGRWLRSFPPVRVLIEHVTINCSSYCCFFFDLPFATSICPISDPHLCIQTPLFLRNPDFRVFLPF